MINSKHIRVGLKIRRIYGRNHPRIQTIISNFKTPVKDYPDQIFAKEHEVYLDTVLNNPYMFEEFHNIPSCPNCSSNHQVGLRDPLDEGGALWKCGTCHSPFYSEITYK